MPGPSTTFSKLEINLRLPAGYRAAAIDHAGSGAVARLCVLAAASPEPGASPFILLRSTVEAQYYLGCLVDNAGRWLEWVELAVQQVEGLQNTPAVFREMLNNHILDTRWGQRGGLLRELQPFEVILTGFESEHPVPLYYDPASGRFVAPEDEPSGDFWRLCRDESVLEAADVPEYRGSLARYLYHPEAGANAGLIPLTKASPLNENTIELTEVLPKAATLKPFNPFCGLLEARRFQPFSYEEYVDLLGGRSWHGLRQGDKVIPVDETWPGLGDLARDGALERQSLFGQTNPDRLLAEVFFLKLNLFTQVLRLVRQVVRRTQLPFLNLSGESFRVGFESRQSALPMLWSARCTLASPGQAVALRVKSVGQRFFIRLGGASGSLYLPGKISQACTGNSEVRIRALQSENGETVVRGTLSLGQPLVASANDILWIRLPAASGMLNFFGHLYPEEALSRMDMPFRTWPLALDEDDVASLRAAAERFNLPPVPYEVIPMLSTPVDLYSLGVLAVRTFLVNEELGFLDAVDDILSLGHEMAARHRPETPLAVRVAELVNASPNWLKHFGPHNLLQHSMDPHAAFQTVPPDQWYELLSLVVSLFPGMGPDSLYPDYGTSPSNGLEVVFDEPLERLERLQQQARLALFPHAGVPAAAPDTEES
jgi:hypothetical protein